MKRYIFIKAAFLMLLLSLIVLQLCGTQLAASSKSSQTISSSPKSDFVLVPTIREHAPRIKNKNGTSTNWSGYAVETDLTNPQDDAVSYVSGTWIVPAAQESNTNTWSSAWVGIDGYDDNTVEQIGTEQDWYNGQPSYYAWYEMYPKWGYIINNFPVNAGDSITAEVQYNNKRAYVLTITNNTQSKHGKTVSFSITQKAPSASRQSAEWIMEAPWSGGVLPLTNFGTIYFTDASATLNGHTGTINDNNWMYDRIDMVNTSGDLKAQTSALSKDGDSFSVEWWNN
jgi:hypothetical protein